MKKVVDGLVVDMSPEEAGAFEADRAALADLDLVPSVISRRQFFQQLAIIGLVTEEEALAAVKTGDLPKPFSDYVSALPADKRFDAEMKMSVNNFERSSPLVDQFAMANGMTSTQVDQIWIDGAKL